MTASTKSAPHPIEPAAAWNELLEVQLKKSPDFPRKFLDQLRAAKMTFGDRVHCPFLRPFFLSPADELLVREVSETIATLGERVVTAALDDKSLFAQFHLRPEEERLARLSGGYGLASTASRLDAFLLPDSLKFAEYNAESPAGAGYSETLAELFRDLPMMEPFVKQFDVHTYPLSAKLLDALVMSYLDWGGTSKRPQIAIVDWKEVPTWTEFEILRARFIKLGVPTLIADPRDLVYDGKSLSAHGKKIDLVYRRVLINDIVARPKACEALVKAYAANAVCVSNTLRCKIPHVKAFFAVLTDERNSALFSLAERAVIQKHVPWTRVVADVKTGHYSEPIELLPFIHSHRENLVLKPADEYGGTGVALGWETTASAWDEILQKALDAKNGTWIVQEQIPVRRENFPHITNDGQVEQKNVLVDFAPYLYRGKLSGFLTRLSATGLANVTSGGGQVPAFRVTPKKPPKKS
jgi:uncharacterized circularly permuted ATP-grasp superfamily protein